MILRHLRNEALRLLAIAGVAYAGILIYVSATESSKVFPAAYLARPDRIPSLPSDYEAMTLSTSDGESLTAHRTSSSDEPSQARWCIFFCGQWGRARWDLPKLSLLRELGYEVLVFDYRGYGGSTGEPDERGLYRDADAAYDYLTGKVGVEPSHILLAAHSLGTGVAIDLASRRHIGGLLVDGAYDSIPSCGADKYPWLPIAWIAKNQFASIEKIAKVKAPKLFLHGEFDESILIRHGRAVFEAALEPKRFVVLEGRHEDAQWSDPDRYRLAVTEFIQQVEAQ